MFFVFGTPRSGTTLLAQCLSAHSKIIIPYETDFIVPMAFIFDRVENEETGRELIYKLIISSKRYPSIAEYIQAETIYEAIYSCNYHPSDILKKLYEKIAEAAGAELAGDKSPNDLGFLHILLKTECISSDMKIIHMVRDIRDLMISLEKTGWIANGQLKNFPGKWNHSNLNLNSLFKDNTNYKLVRYEDLVTNPKAELEAIVQFLGYQFEDDMLNPENRHERYKGIEVHSNLYDPISSDSINQYRSILDKTTIKHYEKIAKKGLVTFGYLNNQSFLSKLKNIFRFSTTL